MVIRQLEPEQFQRLYDYLMATACLHPMEAACTVVFPAEDGEVQVKVLPQDDSVAVLQALRVHRDQGCPWFELITDGPTLAGFLDRVMVGMTA